jgi:hypothetical protein
MELWLFLRALAKHWWALMSCAVFTLIGIFAAALGKSNSWIVSASLIAAVVLFGVACFLSWNDEHAGRVIAEATLHDERPKVMFGVLVPILPSPVPTLTIPDSTAAGEYMFTLTNCGRRPATFVHVNPLSSVSGNFTIYFDDLDVLPPNNHYKAIRHEIDDGQARWSLDNGMLWQFFHNCPIENRTVHSFNVVVNYRDGSETRQTIAKMDFDLEHKRITIRPH